jgi:hypothetical protein
MLKRGCHSVAASNFYNYRTKFLLLIEIEVKIEKKSGKTLDKLAQGNYNTDKELAEANSNDNSIL